MSDLDESISDCRAFLEEAKEWYQAIRLPGELNTRVRAAIESNHNRKEIAIRISETDTKDPEQI